MEHSAFFEHDFDADPRFKLKAFNEISLTTAPNYLVKGLIPRTGLVVVWGPPKCGKSFWVTDVVLHIALGWPYRGRRVRQGAVVYLALEGEHGFRNRIEAWRRRHLNGHHGDVPFFLLDVPVDLVADRPKLTNAIRAKLSELVPVAVVIDTLNRALIGDENKSDDMAKFIRAADMVREAFGCVVIIVHHCGVANNRPRGHSSLSGADDVQIAIARNDDGIIAARVEHMKDGDASPPMASRLERVNLGDDDGDPITSCIIEPADDALAGKKRRKLPADAQLALDKLTELTIEEGRPPEANNHIPTGAKVVSAHLWREYFYKARISDKNDKPDARQKAFVRAVLRLQEHHLIGIWNELVWLADKPDMARQTEKCPVNGAGDEQTG